MKFGFLLSCLLVLTLPRDCFSERCDDWGVDTGKLTQAYDGEPVRIRCPLFEDYLKHNYSTAHSAGLTLMWYFTAHGKDLEEPINIRLPDNRISKDKDILWFRPAVLNDTGNYTCMLRYRNNSFCSKVAFPLEVFRKDQNSCVSAAKVSEEVLLPLSESRTLSCPDIHGYYPANVTHTVKWYMNCNLVDGFVERIPKGPALIFLSMYLHYQGNYTCIVTYEDSGRVYNLTRTMRVKAIASTSNSKPPEMHAPNEVIRTFATGEDMELACEVYFSYVQNSSNEIWWTVNGKKKEDIDPRINITRSVKLDEHNPGAETITEKLNIKNVTPDELKQNYTCSAKNRLGFVSRQAQLKEKVGTPRYITELACGLGATLFLVICFIVVYHVYWLEMVLFYRAHFGTDETIGDGKEYDVYVSYARNAEEEEFVLVTLRGVLENEFGYKLCIFDRDSLPGGIITDETLTFIKKSRRLLVVISPSYVLQGTQALLELKAGLENMASQGNIRLILVQYRAITHKEKVKELKLAQSILTVIKWKGEKSKPPGSRFWKELHVALPIKKTYCTKNRGSFQMITQNASFTTEGL